MNEEFYAQTFPLTPGLVVQKTEIFGLWSLMAVEYPGLHIHGEHSALDGPTTVSTTFDPTSGVLTVTINGVPSTVTLASVSSTLTCAAIGALYTTGTAIATDELLTKNCKSVAISALPISPSQLTPGSLPSTVTISGSQITGALPASVLPPTTVSNTVYGVGAAKTLVTTVNGVASVAVSIPDTDAQALSIVGNVISLTNGGSVSLPQVDCAAIKSAYPTSITPASSASTVLSGDCTVLAINKPVSAFGKPLAFWAVA